jgi:hypothetical protein
MSSNTAERWWVRLAARWLARIDGVKGQVQMFSLAVTAFSTFSLMLQGFGLGYLVPYLAVAAGLGGIVYTYLYTEGGVWNQVARDRRDLSDNFSAPTMLLQNRIQARQFAELAAMMDDDVTVEDAEERLQDSTEQEWAGLRDGVALDDIEATHADS